ncbi:MAG: DMT family transporter [Pseudomonadota bacterium]
MTNRSDRLIGALAWAGMVLVVTAWQVATRWGVTTTLTPLDLALFRYGVPGVVLAPVLLRNGLGRGARPWHIAAIVLGGGLPFGLLGMAGAQFAPAAHMGALLPGAMPLFVAALSALVLKERFDRYKLTGLFLIVCAVFTITGSALGGGQDTLVGDALFLSAAVLWALYTVAFRLSGLEALHGAALVAVASTLLIVPLWIAVPESGLLSAPPADLAVQFVVQGLLAGPFGMVLFGVSVRRLGPAATALSGAVVPAATAAGGWVILNEALSGATAFGIVLTGVGLALFALGQSRLP